MTFRLPFIKPARGVDPLRVDASRANNPNLYQNPIPFVSTDRTVAKRVTLASVALVLPLNLCLFTNPIPFNQTNWTPAQQARELPQQTQNNNLALTAVVATAPFSQTDWSKAQPVKFSLASASQQTNVNLFTNPIPVQPLDWSKPYRTPSVLSEQNNLLNFALKNTVVVVGTEKLRAPYFSRVFQREPNPSDTTWPNIALAPTVAAAAPFVQTDWPKAAAPRIAALDLYNVVLFDGSVPFNQSDWSTTKLPRPRTQDQQPYNLALLTQVVVAAPFYQTDWSTPKRSPSQPDKSAPLNLNLFTNAAPFAQLDWSKTTFQTPRAPDNSLRTNPNLYQNPIPFVQTDWSKTVFQTPRAPDASVQPNLSLNPPPVPPPPEFAVETPPQNSAAGTVVGKKKKKKKPEPPPVIRRAVYERIVEKPEPEEAIEERVEERIEEVKSEPFKGSLLDLAPLPATDPKAALKRKRQEEEEIALFLLGFK